MVLLYLFYRLHISFKSHTHANQYGGTDLTQLFATPPRKENTHTAKQIIIHLLWLLISFSGHVQDKRGQCQGKASGFELSAAGMNVRRHYYTCVHLCTWAWTQTWTRTGRGHSLMWKVWASPQTHGPSMKQ